MPSFAQPEKTVIPERIGDSRTAHLRPVIEFLKARGNRPAGADEFEFERDGLGTYTFADPVDVAAVRERFELPASFSLGEDRIVDGRNFVEIRRRYIYDAEFVAKYRHLLRESGDGA